MPLAPSLVEAAAAVEFGSGTDILKFFQQLTQKNFVDWFNAHCARRGSWAGKAITSSADVRDRFASLWNQAPLIFEAVPFNLLQFGALMSIIIQEGGADLEPLSELCGSGNYPGLSYAFETIPGIKSSYNVSAGNRSAGDLFFADEHFWDAHGDLPTSDLVRAIPNLQGQWKGAVYPRNLFPTSLDPSHTGFLQQADFYKFRGRGFIQLTHRANYRLIVRYIQTYTGSHPVIAQYRTAWTGKDPDTICTISTNEDWDKLFLSTDLIIAARAIGLHNQASGNYLNLSKDAAVLTAQASRPGSFYYMGLRINGSGSYATRFRDRVVELLTALSYKGTASA